MNCAERSQAAVEERLERLEAEWGGVERVEKSWSVSEWAYDEILKRSETGAIGGAGVWVTNEDGEGLLVRNEGDEAWGDPGGKAEPGESLAETAVREVEEETGIECRIEALRQVHVVRMVPETDPDREPIYDLIALFEGVYVAGEPTPAEGEIAEARWWDCLPDDLLYEELAELSIPATEA